MIRIREAPAGLGEFAQPLRRLNPAAMDAREGRQLP
jgi:hypothetical protein